MYIYIWACILGLAAVVPVVDFQDVSYTLGLGTKSNHDDMWYECTTYTGFFLGVFVNPTALSNGSQRMKCPFAILLTKNLNHQNTPWNTCHPALASINCSTESVIPWSFWAWNPLNPGRRIPVWQDIKAALPTRCWKWSEMKWTKCTPQAILQEIYQSSPCREDKQKGKIFKGATSSKNLSDPKRPFFNVLYAGSCVAIDSCEVTRWTWPSWASYDQPYEFSQHIVSMFWSLGMQEKICLLWCISYHSKQPALIQLILYMQQKQQLKTKSFPCTHHTITCVLAPFIPEEALAELPPSCPSSSCESSQNFEPLKIQQFPTKRSCFAVETQLWWINNLRCCDPSVWSRVSLSTSTFANKKYKKLWCFCILWCCNLRFCHWFFHILNPGTSWSWVHGRW